MALLRLFATLSARFAGRGGRTLLSIAGIGLGVALGFAVSLINRARGRRDGCRRLHWREWR